MAGVLEFRASLTYLRFLEPHTSPRAPTKHGERTYTDLTFFGKLLLSLSTIRSTKGSTISTIRSTTGGQFKYFCNISIGIYLTTRV